MEEYREMLYYEASPTQPLNEHVKLEFGPVICSLLVLPLPIFQSFRLSTQFWGLMHPRFRRDEILYFNHTANVRSRGLLTQFRMERCIQPAFVGGSNSPNFTREG